MNMKQIAINIKTAREHLGLTHTMLASLTHSKASEWKNFEEGKGSIHLACTHLFCLLYKLNFEGIDDKEWPTKNFPGEFADIKLTDKGMGRKLPPWLGDLSKMRNGTFSIDEVAEIVEANRNSVRKILVDILPGRKEEYNPDGPARVLFDGHLLRIVGNEYMKGKKYRRKEK